WCGGDAAVRRGRDDALLHERGGSGGAGCVQGEAASGVRPLPPQALTRTRPRPGAAAVPTAAGRDRGEAAEVADADALGRAFSAPLRTRFRGVDVREGLLVRGPAGWGEFSPFPEYGPAECARWWAACDEAARLGWPEPVREQIPVNVTVPAVGPEQASRIVAAGGCGTAKVKVAEAGQDPAEDIARVEAVRDAIGPSGRVRVDANGGWDTDTAVRMVRE